ncbi:hypothetical protein NSE01_31560 [Novosphingobium sediminis]|uniref:Uncharacterized protein n=1 Tax=Novosphingobium sediminis TaxID=707214 RepID=A0A512ANQ0_9SPHN|nr:hypothetical protein NSE01_31560 [Novosphingobium sediminis]
MPAAVGLVSWPNDRASIGAIVSGVRMVACAEPLMVELLGAANAVLERAARAQAMAAIPDRNRAGENIRVIRKEIGD